MSVKTKESVKYCFRFDKKLNSSGEFPPENRIATCGAEMREMGVEGSKSCRQGRVTNDESENFRKFEMH